MALNQLPTIEMTFPFDLALAGRATHRVYETMHDIAMAFAPTSWTVAPLSAAKMLNAHALPLLACTRDLTIQDRLASEPQRRRR